MTPRERVAGARLYLVCDARPRAFLDAALRGGADLIQLRDKTLDDAGLVEAAKVFRAAADAHGALFILNDRPDLVEACDADGVHVGQDDETPAQARAAVGPDRIVGRSTHAPFQADAADADPDVDYLAVGPVHATPTKPGRPAAGLDYVAYAARTRQQAVVRDRRARRADAARGGRGRRTARGGRAGDHRGDQSRGGGPRTAGTDGGARWGNEAVSGGRPRRSPTRGTRPGEAKPVTSPQGEAVESGRFPRAGSRPRATSSAATPAAASATTPPEPRSSRCTRANARPPSPSPPSSPACIAVGNTILVATDTHVTGGQSVTGGLVFAGVMAVAAVFMWRRAYWAVLGFQFLLGLSILTASLSLLVASNVEAVIRSLVIMGAGGTLFWFLIKAMARLQMPTRTR